VNPSTSLGGNPVNIKSFLVSAKQDQSEINVGCVTIVDDDGKLLIDRKIIQKGSGKAKELAARKLSHDSS
jgi:hypothetical protein